jgi:hypothetical protein
VLNGLDIYASDYQYYYYGKYYGSSDPSKKYYSGDHAHDSDETTVTRS